jgi:hypothetical protein
MGFDSLLSANERQPPAALEAVEDGDKLGAFLAGLDPWAAYWSSRRRLASSSCIRALASTSSGVTTSISSVELAGSIGEREADAPGPEVVEELLLEAPDGGLNLVSLDSEFGGCCIENLFGHAALRFGRGVNYLAGVKIVDVTQCRPSAYRGSGA